MIASSSLASTHLILGGDDEEQVMIYYPRQVEEGPDGNLYILDTGDSFIKVFSTEGEHLRNLAGPGEGPGEFQRTDGATFGFTCDDKLYFTEYFGGHHWITILELNGDLVRVISPDLDVGFGIAAAHALPDGRFLVQFTYSSTPTAEKDYFLYHQPLSLALMDEQGEIGAEIVHTKNVKYISPSPNGGTSNLPFTPSFTWTVDENNQVLWSDGMTPSISIYDTGGTLLRELETHLPKAEKVSSKDLKQWREQREEMMMDQNPSWWNRFGSVIKHYDKPLYNKPILQRITSTPDGNFLVGGETGNEEAPAIHWLLDNQGAVIYSFTAAIWRLRFSDHFLFFFSADEDGNTLVHALERPAGDLAGMKKLEQIVKSGDL